MGESRQAMANLFAAFADALNAMDDREFDRLVQGKGKLRLVEEDPGKGGNEGKGKNGRNGGKGGKLLEAPPVTDLTESVPELAQRFEAAASREEAAAVLATVDSPRRKEVLLLLAKEFSVNATARDNIRGIERRLIENVVGARLAAEAIRTVAF